MALADIPLLTAFAEKMRWHQARQGVLSENVANAETPGFRGRDLKQFSFEQHLRAGGQLATTATSAGHIVASTRSASEIVGGKSVTFEITPSGNGVTLEDEMMKVAANQMDYQTVTALYSRSIRIIKTALGRG